MNDMKFKKSDDVVLVATDKNKRVELKSQPNQFSYEPPHPHAK